MDDPLSVAAAARAAPAAPALRSGELTWTFAELAERVRERLAELDLAALRGAPYPLVGSNTPDALVTLYALLEARVPALLLHPRLTAPEEGALRALAARAGPVTQPDAAAILFTSGTTGEPRAAVLTRAGLVAAAAANEANLGWEADDCWLLCMPLARVGGLSVVTRCLAARRCVALAPGFDAVRVPEWIATQRATLVSLVPTMLDRVLDAHPRWTCPPSLRAILLGGAAASRSLLERAAARGLPLLASYGLTESCAQIVATPYDERFALTDDSVGAPLFGAEVRIVDGHIQIRGPMLMAGYWNEPPLAPGAWFDTGDLGEIDARGRLRVHARRTDLIVTGGENVYPAEVERTLERCPGIVAAGVFGLADERWGQTVAAALVAQPRAPADEALVDFVAAHLAPHKRPRHVCYVARLPQTPAGKLDRRALTEFAGALRPLRARTAST